MDYPDNSGIYNGIESTFEEQLCNSLDTRSELAGASPLVRTAWILYEKGYSEREIAALAGISQESVSRRINTVYEIFRNSMIS